MITNDEQYGHGRRWL